LKKLRVLITVFMVLVLAFILFAGGCAPGASSKMSIVTSTSLLYYIVQQVGGDKANIVNLVPPAQHPGNFDFKPVDVQTLANAKLFLLHGWPGEGYADKLIAAAANPNLAVVKANVDGNWMIPSIQLAATDKVAGILGEADKANAAVYQKAAADYKVRVQAKDTEIKARLTKANLTQINVIASFWQADFLKWVGFNVIATYNDPASLTPQALKDLVDKGKTAGVTLVFDNLQSAKDAGKGLALELGGKNINLSSFPGGFDNTETWEKAIDKNIDLILAAAGK
jgi:ABC-type Zn uptake system ZnuABC Zn-binding protein ZnuA